MTLLIDAFNVLHCTHVLPEPYALINVPELCQLLERSRWQARRMIVVCDGAIPSTGPGYQGPVELIYAGGGRDADSVIERLILEDSAPRHMTVVSNDRRLQKAARRRRAKVLLSEQFLKRLIEPPPAAAPPAPPKPEHVENVTDWVDTFEADAREIEAAIEAQHAPAPTPSHPPTAETPPAPEPKLSEEETRRWMEEFGFTPDDSDHPAD